MDRARVLIVEDESIVAFNMQQQLIELGYDVPAIAASGREALDKIKQCHPAVVLMDINIDGEFDGIETTRLIPESLDVAVIYVTAYSEETTVQRARLTTPYAFVVKPVSQRELHAAIQMALERRNKTKSDREALIKLEQVADVHDAALRTALRDRKEQTEALKEIEGILKVALERAQESQGRVQAASIIINTIYQSYDFKQVDFKRFLETLIAKVVESDPAKAERIKVVLEAAPLNLPFNLAIPCGLIANELLVNAFKHAYPGDKKGEIRIDLALDERDNLVLKVKDNGIGLRHFPPLFHQGVRGLELIHVLAKDLDGKLDVETVDSTCFTLHLPLHPEKAQQVLIA